MNGFKVDKPEHTKHELQFIIHTVI